MLDILLRHPVPHPLFLLLWLMVIALDVIDKPRDDIAHSLCNLHPAMSILSTKQQTFASVQHVQIVVNEGATAFEFLVQSDYEG